MVNVENVIQDDTNAREDHTNCNFKSDKMKTFSPIATISIITLIGLVCVIIDFYLELE